MAIRVLVADDHKLFLLAVRTVLARADDIEVVGEAASGNELLRLVAPTRPDVVLLDYGMPAPDGLACLEAIRRRHPEVKVAMLSAQREPAVIEASLRLGARAFIQKSINPADLPAVIRHVVDETVIVSKTAAGIEPARSDRTAGDPSGLTDRELGILQGLARGLSNQAIAREHWIAEPTVKFHVRNIYRKLSVSNRTEAARYAFEHGLVAPARAEGELVPGRG